MKEKQFQTEQQRKKARVTGSSSRMIEVCACLSSELFQAAALSEHAPDEVSQGREKAVITGRLEGCSIRQIADRSCVRHTHWTIWRVSGPGYSHRVNFADRQTSFCGFIFSHLSVSFFPFFSLLLFSFLERTGSEREPLTGLLKYLCIQGKDKNVISNETRVHINTCSESATHMKHLPHHHLLEIVKRVCLHQVLWILAQCNPPVWYTASFYSLLQNEMTCTTFSLHMHTLSRSLLFEFI